MDNHHNHFTPEKCRVVKPRNAAKEDFANVIAGAESSRLNLPGVIT